MQKRKVEVFTLGCNKCQPTVDMVNSLACDSCDVVVYDVTKPCKSEICLDLVKQYDITSYPAVVVNGALLECCKDGKIASKESLQAAGIGKAN